MSERNGFSPHFPANFIPDDGYTQPGYIQAVPRLHGELRYVYRPMLAQQRAPLLDAARDEKGDKYERLACKLACPHITSWSLIDAKGEPVAITAPNMLRVRPAMLSKLINIVAGLQASDVDPEWPEEVAREMDDDDLPSAVAGESRAVAREREDVGN